MYVYIYVNFSLEELKEEFFLTGGDVHGLFHNLSHFISQLISDVISCINFP